MKKARWAGLLSTTLLFGCGAPSCPKSPPAPAAACPPSEASAMMPQVDEEATKALEERIAKLRKGGRRTVTYKAPTNDEERAYAAWVRDALVAATERKEPPKKAPEGFSLRVLGDVWLLEEARKKKRGAGVIVMRTGRARPILVEAPHTFYDAGTLPIALSVFDAQAARVLLINTVHRYIDKPEAAKDGGAKDEKAAAGKDKDKPKGTEAEGDEVDEKDDDKDDDKGAAVEEPAGVDRDEADDANAAAPVVASDVAHAERSFFHAAHRELVALVQGAVTVQIHGFKDDKSEGTGIIVSAAKTNADAASLAARLGPAVTDTSVKIYPTDVSILGGTINQQARTCRELGAPFFHVEISRTVRDALGADKQKRARFAAALDPIFARSLPPNP
ncbi:hypothetical protein [Polyangium jinanense]|uniref:Lipoprotein n=1 Tax=Polyangium jinanense TaxID=2829994 RepID=A0A9X3X4Z3_9BACT|nr:hypothetical protein [Polyangium jinanense]MDC3961083.1 hypothetical protein [Polyangium jinanense]MDC3982840.1 hypothetical protein [Polyangium jinanense]